MAWASRSFPVGLEFAAVCIDNIALGHVCGEIAVAVVLALGAVKLSEHSHKRFTVRLLERSYDLVVHDFFPIGFWTAGSWVDAKLHKTRRPMIVETLVAFGTLQRARERDVRIFLSFGLYSRVTHNDDPRGKHCAR